jgi:hypothetical protein
MNTTEIKKLIEKYFEGEANQAEEALLRDFFLHEKVPADLAIYSDLFRYFSDIAKDEISDPDFEQKFLSQIKETPVIPLSPKRRRIYYIASIAAGIFLLCGLIFTFRHDIIKNPGNHRLKDTYTNPADAYFAAKKALLMVSVNLNTGLNEIRKLQSFQKGMEKIETFSQFYKFQQIIINPDEIDNRPQNH